MLSDRSDKARIKACDFGEWVRGNGCALGEKVLYALWTITR